ncbi:MAG: 3-dehydroquinate synthase [Woeseiaceae bacterium]
MDNQPLKVELGERSYPIVIGSGLIAGGYDLSPYTNGRDCLIVSNDTVAPLYLENLTGCLPGVATQVVELPDGESHKTIASAAKILDELVGSRAGRDVTVIALGGGVVGDIAGFAAACYMRGVAFAQVPTTLLAQVDSSVGGKTGVNHPGGKNLIGAFHQPRVVLIDTDTLATLPDRDLRAGIAEVIKYGAITDAAFFAWLEDNVQALVARETDALTYAIRKSCEIKAAVVAEDEKETGRRALLNFGHTFGHAIENSVGYGEWLHGEAVAAGMVMAADMSGLAAADGQRLKALLGAAGLPVSPPLTRPGQLRDAMQLDKKAEAGRLRFVLLRAIGDAYVTADYDSATLNAVLGAAENE